MLIWVPIFREVFSAEELTEPFRLKILFYVWEQAIFLHYVKYFMFVCLLIFIFLVQVLSQIDILFTDLGH